MPGRCDHTQVTVYLPRSLSARLAGRAASLGRSVSEHLRQLASDDLAVAERGMNRTAGCPSRSDPLVHAALRMLVERAGGDWAAVVAAASAEAAGDPETVPTDPAARQLTATAPAGRRSRPASDATPPLRAAPNPALPPSA